MRLLVGVAAAIVLASTSMASAGTVRITFNNISGFPTGCGLDITFSDVAIPGDPPSLATAKPSGTTCVKTGVAIGGIGTAIINGEHAQVLTLGQNVNGSRNHTLLYVIQLNGKNKLVSGNAWASFDTVDGKTVNGPTNGGTYTIPPRG